MNLSDLRQLTTLQFDESKERAAKRVGRHLGERPTPAQFGRDMGRLWTVLDVLALVVFIPALLISSIHIITHVGALSSSAYDGIQQSANGTVFTRDLFVASHQWLLIPLAEGSMILFLVMFGVSRDGWRRWVYFVLAGLAVLFVLTANLSSGLGLLESVLAPAFTIGIGLKLEHLIMQHLKRSNEIARRYREALDIWEAAALDPAAHPNYRPYLMAEIWAALMKPKGNQWATEAGPGFKRAAVERELERDNWTIGDVQPVTTFTPAAEEEAPSEPLPKAEEATGPTPAGLGVGIIEPSATPLITGVNGYHSN